MQFVSSLSTLSLSLLDATRADYLTQWSTIKSLYRKIKIHHQIVLSIHREERAKRGESYIFHWMCTWLQMSFRTCKWMTILALILFTHCVFFSPFRVSTAKDAHQWFFCSLVWKYFVKYICGLCHVGENKSDPLKWTVWGRKHLLILANDCFTGEHYKMWRVNSSHREEGVCYFILIK